MSRRQLVLFYAQWLVLTIFCTSRFRCNANNGYETAFICYDDWYLVDSFLPLCIYKSNDAQNWQNSQISCRSNGSSLLILDARFYDAINYPLADIIDSIHNYIVSEPVAISDMWVGIHIDNGKLYWDGDTPLAVNSSYYDGYQWSAGFPDAKNGSQCGAVLNVTSTTYDSVTSAIEYFVSLVSCEDEKQFVCVKSASRLLPQNLPALCPDGWYGDYSSQLCYWGSNVTANYTEAEQFCKNLNNQSALAKPADYFQLNFTSMTSIVQSETCLSVGNDNVLTLYYWIDNSSPVGAPQNAEQSGRRTFTNPVATCRKVSVSGPVSGANYDYGQSTTVSLGLPAYAVDTPSNAQYITTQSSNSSLPVYVTSRTNDVTSCISLLLQSVVTFLEYDCNNRLYFACQMPAFRTDLPEINNQPISDVIMLNNYTQYNLTCNASKYHPELPVVWVKDDVYISTTIYPPSGLMLNLQVVYDLLSLTTPSDLQGYYHCEVWSLSTVPYLQRQKSNSTLLTFVDVATFPGILQMTNATISEQLVQLCSITFCQQIVELEVKVQSVFSQIPADLLISSVVKSIGDSQSSQSVLFVLYVQMPIVTASSSGQIEYLKERIYNELFEVGASDLAVKDFILLRADACVSSVQASDMLTFPVTLIGGTANSAETCLDGTPAGIGRCVGNFTSGGSWLVTVNSQFYDVPEITSAVTSKLQQLTRLAVTYSNVIYVTSLIASLTARRDIITDDDVTYVANVLNKIAQLPSIDSQVVDDFYTAVDNVASLSIGVLYQTQFKAQSTSRITSSVEIFNGHVKLPGSQTNMTIVKRNLLVQISELTDETESYAVRFRNESWTEDPVKLKQQLALDVLTDWPDNNVINILSPGESAFVITRQSLEEGSARIEQLWNGKIERYRVCCVCYRTFNLFGVRNSQATGNSVVISGAFNGISFANLTNPISVVFQLMQPSSLNMTCAYWGFNNATDDYRWMTDGVSLNSLLSFGNTTEYVAAVCLTNHLTNFAVLVGFDEPENSSTIAIVLQWISIIGLSLSLAGLAFIIISQIVFQALKKGKSYWILFQLAVALLAVDILVLAGIDKTNPVAGCKAVAALLLYFLLVAFSWMLVEAIVMYLKFVKVFDTYTSHFILKTALPAWILPGVIVAVVSIVDRSAVTLLRGPTNYCWLSADAFHFAFLLPLGLILVVNLVMFVLVIKGVTCDRPKDLRSTQTKCQLFHFQLQIAIGCFIVMGLTWLFAFFAIDRAAVAFQILFCIFNSIQGFILFIFFNLREKSINNVWKSLFAKFRTCWRLDGVTRHKKHSHRHADKGNNLDVVNHSTTSNSVDQTWSATEPTHSTGSTDSTDGHRQYMQSPADTYITVSNSIYGNRDTVKSA